jgi:hypothetical protein
MASRGKGSRDKGARYEREIASRFKDKFDIDVNRTGSQERWSYYGGDVHAPDNSDTILNDYFFELKNRENLPKTIIKWYSKAKDDAEGSYKKPVVVTTRNNEDDYVFLTLDDFEALLFELEGYRKED